MALKKHTLAQIATILKIKEADLETAIKDEKEVDLTIDDKLQAFTEAEVTTLKNNEYTRGKEAGVEMEIKEAKTKHSLDFTGKTIDGLLGAYKTKVIADEGKAPDAKVKEYETKIATLTSTVTDLETKLATKETEVEAVHINGELYKHIPAPGDKGPALSQDEVIALMKSNGYEFKRENGTMKPYKGGQLQTDKLGNAVPVGDVVKAFMNEKKIGIPAPDPGGREGKDKHSTTKATNMTELKKQFTDQGKSLNGQEFMSAASEAMKDKDFKANE
ncbi:hypothetical protein [Paraflavitalea sp. CAU 1676]|uniref:hypothetical protein n=1 Tax=Paraflavitalea sp. CAU 1676 TaxID=3032598 RepID=UPI0023D9E7E7|nr:hypothetical protein [Paraflavitalea sp. CAU 1676]MDF2189292.1 hypothetical protein [Paraflavitalea sp. CAU 1676]